MNCTHPRLYLRRVITGDVHSTDSGLYSRRCERTETYGISIDINTVKTCENQHKGTRHMHG